jgi:hypothetical protein
MPDDSSRQKAAVRDILARRAKVVVRGARELMSCHVAPIRVPGSNFAGQLSRRPHLPNSGRCTADVFLCTVLDIDGAAAVSSASHN